MQGQASFLVDECEARNEMTEAAIQQLYPVSTLHRYTRRDDAAGVHMADYGSAPTRRVRADATPSCPVLFVVDRDPAMRASLADAAERAGYRAETFACASDFPEVPVTSVPSCLVLDVTTPNSESLALQKRLTAARKEIPILVIASDPDIGTTVQAMRTGALDFFLKPIADSILLGGVQRAIELSAAIHHHEAHMRALRERHEALSRRERQIMTLVIAGLLNKQIAGELGISEITVKAHRGKVMRKMQAGSLANLVMIAGKIGLAPVAGVTRNHVPLYQVA